jgi:hypothetical protein
MKTSLYLAGMGCALGLLVTTTNCPAQTAPANPTQQELLDEVRALRSEVKDLHAQLNAQRPTTQPASQSAAPFTASDDVAAGGLPAQAAPTDAMLQDIDRRKSMDMTGISAGWDPAKGFVIRSEDGNFLLHPWAFIQIRDTTNYRQGGKVGGGDTTDTGLELPRMKLILDGNIFSTDFTYQIIWATATEGAAAPAGGSLFLQEAWGRYHLPETPFAIRAGNMRDPFDHEQILFGTRSLTPERSIINNVLANGDNIVKGVSASYGYDLPSPFRTEIAYTGGMRNTDTSFVGFPTNPATWGAAGRFEYKFFGDWKDYTQFTALGDKHPLLVLGGGIDYTEAGKTGNFSHVIDVQFDTPDGLNVYAAYLGRYVSHNAGTPGTNGAVTTAGRFPDTYDETLRLQAGYLFAHHFEPFARYEYIHFSGLEIARTSPHNVLQDMTVGFNYYFVGHRAKFSAAASYLPDGSPIANTQSDLLSNRKNEVLFQAQFQLMI